MFVVHCQCQEENGKKKPLQTLDLYSIFTVRNSYFWRLDLPMFPHFMAFQRWKPVASQLQKKDVFCKSLDPNRKKILDFSFNVHHDTQQDSFSWLPSDQPKLTAVFHPQTVHSVNEASQPVKASFLPHGHEKRYRSSHPNNVVGELFYQNVSFFNSFCSIRTKEKGPVHLNI